MTLPVYVLNGPNLNLIGSREPEVYGRQTLSDIEKTVTQRAKKLGLEVVFRQSNHEGELVDWVQEARTKSSGVIINAGAYIAEIVRGSFLSVHRGLKEAGLALGLPFWKVLLYIIGPLAFRRMIPALGNQFIVSLKDTSLFIVIGVGELTRQGQEIMAANFRAVEIWSAVAMFYLIMTGTLTLILRLTEKRMRIL